jgi:hypothetical protein
VELPPLHRVAVPTSRVGAVADSAVPPLAAVPPPVDAFPTSAPSGIVQRGFLAGVVRVDASGRRRLAPAWPLWALLVGFPIWWALGLGSFVFVLLAIPMAVELRRRRPLRLPRAWPLWVLYLLWVALSLVMYAGEPSGAHPGALFGRLLATATLLIQYAAGTIALLFAGNLTREEAPSERIVAWFGIFFLVTLGGGLLGTLLPHFQFTAPLEYLLPGRIRSNRYVQSLVHPAAAQLQNVLGSGETGRAAAPFGYTNFWANNLSILSVWFVCGWWAMARTSARRWMCMGALAIALLPVVYSLNRGLWIGIAVSVVWVAVRLFLSGKAVAVVALLAAVLAGTLLVLLTPLQNQFSGRLSHGESNSIRSFLTTAAVSGAEQSPVLGWGGSRKTIGSAQSAAIGATPDCPQCGNFTIGSNGQFWAILFDQGFVGTALYLSFFLATVVAHWRNRSPIGQAGVLIVALSFVYMFVYSAMPAAFVLTMISIGVLERSSAETGMSSRRWSRRLSGAAAP